MKAQPDMDLSAERANGFPTWLRVWLALQAVGLIMGLVREGSGSAGFFRFAFWFVLLGALSWGMYKHAKGAWVIAVALAILGVIGGVTSLFAWRSPFDQHFAWVLGGFLLVIADLAVLVSRPARAWVNEPTNRKWSYSKS